MKNLFKDFLFFTKGEKRGIVLLMGLIVATVLGNFMFSHWRENREPSPQERLKQQQAVKETNDFLASIKEVERKQKKRSNVYKSQPTTPPVVLEPFDPNSADSAAFCRLGLPAWMAHNILHYRSKGGKFRQPEDFKKIYGLTEEQYTTLLPYLRIVPEEKIQTHPRLFLTETKIDSVVNQLFKYPPGTVIELNQADTIELKKIPGIGSGIARMIVSHRERLGGFYSIEQLHEVNLDASQLKAWFRIDPQHIRRINVNSAGVEQLRRHPYINFYQAKAIVEYRQKEGVVKSLKPFALYDDFSATDFERIGHYICF